MGYYWVDIKTAIGWQRERFSINKIGISALLNNAMLENWFSIIDKWGLMN